MALSLVLATFWRERFRPAPYLQADLDGCARVSFFVSLGLRFWVEGADRATLHNLPDPLFPVLASGKEPRDERKDATGAQLRQFAYQS